MRFEKISFLLTKYPIVGRKRPQQILIFRIRDSIAARCLCAYRLALP